MLTSSKVTLNPIVWKSPLTRWWELIVTQTALISNSWLCQQLKDWTSVFLLRSGVPVIYRYTDWLLITHNSMWLGHSCPASTVPQQMLPCCECHPSQDHVTKNRIQCAQSTAGTARVVVAVLLVVGGGLSTGCGSACSYCLYYIKYQYQFQLSASL